MIKKVDYMDCEERSAQVAAFVEARRKFSINVLIKKYGILSEADRDDIVQEANTAFFNGVSPGGNYADRDRKEWRGMYGFVLRVRALEYIRENATASAKVCDSALIDLQAVESMPPQARPSTLDAVVRDENTTTIHHLIYDDNSPIPQRYQEVLQLLADGHDTNRLQAYFSELEGRQIPRKTIHSRARQARLALDQALVDKGFESRMRSSPTV